MKFSETELRVACSDISLRMLIALSLVWLQVGGASVQPWWPNCSHALQPFKQVPKWSVPFRFSDQHFGGDIRFFSNLGK
jgi:hypothetical protein